MHKYDYMYPCIIIMCNYIYIIFNRYTIDTTVQYTHIVSKHTNTIRHLLPVVTRPGQRHHRTVQAWQDPPERIHDHAESILASACRNRVASLRSFDQPTI